MTTRCCPHCKETKPFDAFGYTKSGQVKSWCRICTRQSSEVCRQARIKRDPEYVERRKLYSRHIAENKPHRVVHMFHSIKKSAISRGLTFALLKSDISSRIDGQDWKCARTGVPFDLTTGHGKRPFGPTVDRIDSSRGYEPENIQIVCNMYNYAKNEFSDSDVLRFASAVINQSVIALQRRIRDAA